MKNLKLKIKNYRLGYIIIVAFYILHFTFYIAAPPDSAQIIGPYCFREQECAGTPYRGIPKEANECDAARQGQLPYDNGYRYNCFSPPPSVPLQVSIGGKYEVEGIEGYILQLYTYLV